ncbi:hypothetical protein BYT27DRAFT_7249811 [Phlegmacium glaucopus]|nr:hypothetical protein BYT27DRAFT_7249811 [Phlegmacium glaucopus]
MAAEVITATPHGTTISASAANRSIDFPGSSQVSNNAYGRHENVVPPNSSVPTRAEDNRNRDPQSPPGLCKRNSKLIREIVLQLVPDPPVAYDFHGAGTSEPMGLLQVLPIRTVLQNPILTDVWIYDTDSKTKLATYIEQIFSYIKKYNIEIPGDTCLVLELSNSGKYGYYFVDHAKQCLIWLDEFNGMDFLGKIKVKYTPSHIGESRNEIFVLVASTLQQVTPLEILFKTVARLHNHLFPNLCPLQSSAISEIKDGFIHEIGNSLTSSRGLAPYSSEDLQKMLDLVNAIEASNSAQGELATGSIAIISRFLQNFHHERFLHLHRQINALGMPFHTFYGPMIYLRKLRKITVDGLVNGFVWKDLLGQLTANWREFTLYVTVLLNANVAFLAIPSVDNSAHTSAHGLYAQVASYFR